MNAAVTVSGAVSDALSGVSSVTCDGAAANVTGGNFSCNISLTVGVNLVVVRATDMAGNVAASNFHLSLMGTLPVPNSLQISPAGVNMLVGETRQFAAADELGRVRSDASWAVSDSTLATITADSSPTLTAVATGQVTLTATVQSITAQVQLNILSGATLPPGTVRWSAPPLTGFTTRQIIQAVPTAGNGPDLYSHEIDSNGNGLIRAFTADGLPLWQASLGPSDYSGVTPDGFGGLLVSNTSSSYQPSTNSYPVTTTLTDRDSVTGAPVWTYSPGAYIGQSAIRADGTIFFVQATPQDSAGNIYTYLVALNGNSGTPVFSLQLPDALVQTFNCNGSLSLSYYTGGDSRSNLAIDTDGTVSLAIISRSATGTLNCDNTVASSVYTTSLSLFQLKPDGSTSVTPVRSTTVDNTQPGTTVPKYDAWQVIPDGQGGTLVAWTDNTTPNQPLDYVTHLSASGNSDFYFPALHGPIASMVLGENGAAYLTDVQTIQAFNITSGPLWNYVSPGNGVEIIASSAGGGLVTGEFPASNAETVLRFDSTGQPTYDGTGNATPAPAFGSLFQASWTGEILGLSTSSSSPALSVATFTTPVVDWANSLWAAPDGGPARNDGSAQMSWFPPLQTCPGASKPCAGEATWNAFKALKTLMAGPNCPLCNTQVFTKLGITQSQFYTYLSLPPLLSDGTRSNAPMNHVMCNWWNIFCAYGSETVANFMQRKGSDAISRTPSPKGVVIFFNPVVACTAGTSPGTILNEAMLFHETLHGFTGLGDNDLANALGANSGNYNINTQGSVAITYYLENYVLGGNLTYYDPNPSGNEPLVCQN